MFYMNSSKELYILARGVPFAKKLHDAMETVPVKIALAKAADGFFSLSVESAANPGKWIRAGYVRRAKTRFEFCSVIIDIVEGVKTVWYVFRDQTINSFQYPTGFSRHTDIQPLIDQFCMRLQARAFPPEMDDEIVVFLERNLQEFYTNQLNLHLTPME